MMMDRENEREIELERAMYANCLLLGLDPAIIGIGGSTGIPPVGRFRHSNPKLGEQLLYFILSSLRGPIQSAEDFDQVWPILDAAQSHDFRKVVQGIISELESQGALPMINARVSSLSTYCGFRFVELLWQLSLHALLEVHSRTFAADVASNPLPAPLTDAASSHAITLLPVTKAWIALERRKFLKNAEAAVQRQRMWSNLAHEMTAEFRGLYAEEAYLQQELKKVHNFRNKVKLEGELWNDLLSSSSQNSNVVSKANRLWESLLAHKGQYEVLASDPIKDLIAHREHMYRISGSSLVAAMDHNYEAPCADKLYGQPGDLPNVFLEDKETNDALDLTNETLTGMAGKAGRVHQAVDVAEVIWHWAHALQRIEKKSLHWAKANDGEGPDILRNAQGGLSDHAESLAVTLAEHQQHLASFQVLINQLKEVAPAIQNSISECTDKLNNITSNLPPMNRLHGRPMSPIKAHGRMNSDTDEVAEVTSRISNVQFDRRRQGTVLQTIRTENLPDRKSLDTSSSTQSVRLPEGSDSSDVQNLKREVRETALSLQPSNSVSSLDSHSDGSSEHFFAPLSESRFSHLDAKERIASLRSRRLFVSQLDSPLESHASDGHGKNQLDENLDMLNDLEKLSDYDHVNGCLSYTGSNATSETQWSVYDFEDAQDEVFSPPLLMDSSLLADSFEDLLAPLSDSEMALMEQ